MMRLGILGGGLTGVVLGRLLNFDVEILEKNGETGGLCRSLCEDGFTFDYGGSHVIFSRNNDVLKFMVDALGENKVRRRRNTKVLYNGHYVKYPFENGLSDLPKQDNFECLYHYVDAQIREARGHPRKPENFREWIYQTFGQGIAEKYMIPYNEKIWNTKAELMGVEWVRTRIPQPPMEDVIRSSLGIETEGYKHQLYFYYPREGGIQSLIGSIESRVNGKVTTNFDVSSIRKEDGTWVVSDGNQERVFDKIVSTIPLFELVSALKDVPEEVGDAVSALKYNSLITVMIGVDAPKLNDISWLYIPDRDVKAHRVSFPSNYSPCVAPDGKSSVLAEITCTEGDEIWRKSDENIAREVILELDALKILDKDAVCYSSVRRSKYAYVIYDLNYPSNIETANRYFNEIGVDLCGRFSQFRYLNMDACIRNAMAKAHELNAVVR